MGCFNERFWKGTGGFQIPLLKTPHPKRREGKKNHFTQGDSLFLPMAGTHLGANPSCTRGAVGPLGLGNFGKR